MAELKTMATKSGEVNPTIQISREIPTDKLEGLIGAAVYADFPTSTTMSFDTYSKRMEAVASALGNKDAVKG